MKLHNPELISALLDGELHGWRRWLVERHLKRCVSCAAEFRHLHHVREMLAANRVAPTMGDSQDFFWSKVKRDIQAREGQSETIPMPRLGLTDWIGQHQYAVASAAVALVAVFGVVVALHVYQPTTAVPGPAIVAKVPLATVERVETTIPNATATAFQAHDAGATVIWVSGLPWTKDMKEMQTLYANLDS